MHFFFYFSFGLLLPALLGTTPARASCDSKKQCCLGGNVVAPRLQELAAQVAQSAFKAETARGQASRAARILRLILFESGGDPTTAADMRGRRASRIFGWGDPGANSRRWTRAEVTHNLRARGRMTYDDETNFGLLQQSPNVLTTDTSQTNARRFSEYQALIQKDPQAALDRCQTRDFFEVDIDAQRFWGTAASCHPKKDRECFARLAMLCPRLNVELGVQMLKTRPSYFSNPRIKGICATHLLAQIRRLTKAVPEQTELPTQLPSRGSSTRSGADAAD